MRDSYCEGMTQECLNNLKLGTVVEIKQQQQQNKKKTKSCKGGGEKSMT